MRARAVGVLLLAVLVAAGCATPAELKSRKDNAWSDAPYALPDTHRPNPNAYGHPFRLLGFALHPVGVALDYALVRPFYLLGGLAPEWFGLTVDDAQRYQLHHPELVVPQNAPKKFE
ncbi:MAG: hypothetical protein HYV62_06950 [Candidatus Rokubacteria bacterium]|nr:hypothetical protein [Candidatus Rokubacteria bacterium]